MVPKLQRFGNSWTQDKLDVVRKYLVAFATILKGKPFKYAYIDGFAGTGYYELKKKRKKKGEGSVPLFPELEVSEVAEFLKGSARIALEVEPPFQSYIFVEMDRKKTAELEKLKTEFPEKAKNITIITSDANSYLQELCKKSWKDHRAVLFIDPFATELSWKTLESIAKTEAIDTWILFPLMAVNRLLKRDRRIPADWQACLDTMFGDSKWFGVFFPQQGDSLFGADPEARAKISNIKPISEYFNRKLKDIFAGVAKNPLTLTNKKGAPLFLLCFAAANPKAAKLAVKIAEDILKSASTK